MNKLFNKLSLKFLLAFIAVIIAIGSLMTSNYLISDLQEEESKRMGIWAEAMRSITLADENTDLNLVLKVIEGNNTIPVIVLDDKSNVISSRNIEYSHNSATDSIAQLTQLAKKMISDGNVIKIDMPEDLGAGKYWNVCYDESTILKRLNVYPYFQLGVVAIFVIITLFALFSTLKAEQNKVWVGLSKETAHQLGTPISSLIAWCAILKENYPDDELIPEMENDVNRLQIIAERFSKIGSIPQPKPEDLVAILQRVVTYMSHRTSNKVKISLNVPNDTIIVRIIPTLFEWVAENLCKNAVDAMSGSGKIDIIVSDDCDNVLVDFVDNGKGILNKHFSSVFTPGFTTKERGWGLGLSLAKRIVEEYHKGKIYVKSSKVGEGTTFRIELPKRI